LYCQGSFSKEVANYLNSKNEPKNLNVIMSPKAQTLKPFLKGKVFSPEESIPNNKKADYLVPGTESEIPEKYKYCNFDKNIEFRGKLFWKIYNCK